MKRGVGLWVREGVVSVHLVYQAFMMLAQRRGAGWGYNLVRAEAGPRGPDRQEGGGLSDLPL